MKRALIVVISVLVAGIAAMSASAVDPQPAQAAGGGNVEKCGGEIFLNEEFREIGVGTRTGEFKGFKGVTMYTVDFGVRR
jgi:opacity protein-like surface antigen